MGRERSGRDADFRALQLSGGGRKLIWRKGENALPPSVMASPPQRTAESLI